LYRDKKVVGVFVRFSCRFKQLESDKPQIKLFSKTLKLLEENIPVELVHIIKMKTLHFMNEKKINRNIVTI
jgi:hypothetical protein